MKLTHKFIHRQLVRLGRAVILLTSAAGITVLLMWLAGSFALKVSTASEQATQLAVEAPANLARPRLIRLPLIETAVGTIRPVHETSIGAKLLARVVEVNVRAGQTVAAGDVLVRLDDADLLAKRRQAAAVVNAAEALRAQAELDAERLADLFKSAAVSRQESEQAATAFLAADAELHRAQESIHEIQTTLDWATIRSPLNGIVIDKKVDVGDMVTPGQILATLYDPQRMQLVANVRESLAHRLQVGQSIDVQFENLSKRCTGSISEVVPQAETSSRAFQVKVTGRFPEGVYSGMFGRILIPLDEEPILVIRREAVQRVGQLELVNVSSHGVVTRRSVRLGRILGDDVEVLSGLRLDE